MKISTKRGDLGKTYLHEKEFSKDNPLIELLGILDECNAYFIYLYTQDQNPMWKERVQELVELSAFLAGYKDDFSSSYINKLEEVISQKEQDFCFTYPFENQQKALINITRTIVRKAERTYIRYASENINETIEKYLNRLSDFLYVFI